ncbi:MAG: valine--tRNA ligase [Planctomycetes bacterium]|nr:valine--tRNA ligase [Planctomycetota bacterium]
MSSKSKQEVLASTYNSSDVEQDWYDIWEKGQYFKPRKGKQNETFSIVMPPPNVTGMLHAGHALDVTTQDALIRYKRMKGFETLWLPGMDHAGIATQSVVEKMVHEKEGKTRHEFSREDFLKKIWNWKEEYGGIIAKQQRKMGASPDWDYSLFTMDPDANEAVVKVFVDLFNEGLIYQSDYIVNWDPKLQSAISDAEVEHIEVKGAFYHITYQVEGSEETLEVATTRPETMLGDTAVSVHPEDPRYQHLIGKNAIIPIINKAIPIIADEHVDRELGTGCLKVTPGHDFNDFEIGKRHNLPIVNILNLDGTLNECAGEFAGMTCKKAREKFVEKLEELGALVSIKEHTHQVGHGDRSKSIIEPMVSKQWFLNVKEMAKQAVEAVEQDDTRFYPKGWENTYFSWLREPKDWCISRQLWWGHRIPVYYCGQCEHKVAADKAPESCSKCGSQDINQDPDVLDTWFSSGLWPLSTLGWPDKERMAEKGFDRFYPTTVLVTGFDIIFFWVARMMMMGMKSAGNIPFEKVYIHAIVRDKLGRKMSKSLGNGIDPLEMIEQYGADAFRFTLAAGSGYNRTLNLDPERISGYRNFINKIWNAFRFIRPFIDESQPGLPEKAELSHHERWILSELNTITADINHSMDEFRFDDACQSIYSFLYHKFCSWFIELSKPILHGDDDQAKARRVQVLRHCFKNIVSILHPIAPYITEELWMYLKDSEDDLLIVQDYPEYDEALNFKEDQSQMNLFIEVTTAIRNLRASVDVKPKDYVNTVLFTDDKNLSEYYYQQKQNFAELAKVKNLSVLPKSEARPKKSVMQATAHTEVFLPLDGVIDLSKQIERLKNDLVKVEQGLQKLDKKLGNARFMDNAPEDVVADVRSKAKALEDKSQSLKNTLANFQN